MIMGEMPFSGGIWGALSTLAGGTESGSSVRAGKGMLRTEEATKTVPTCRRGLRGPGPYSWLLGQLEDPERFLQAGRTTPAWS